MSTHRQLLQAVTDNLTDLSRQLIFADYVEEHGDATLAQYVRMHVELWQLSRAPDDAGQYKRKTHLLRKAAWFLRQNPSCWQWDNVLAVEKLPARKRSIWNKRSTADASVIQQLEETLQQELPVGFRTWLVKVANGQPQSKRKGTLYSAERILDELEKDPAYLHSATSPCELQWSDLRILGDQWILDRGESSLDEVESLATRLPAGNAVCPGYLRIGEFFQSFYCLILSGDLRGAVWHTGSDGSEGLYFDISNVRSASNVRNRRPLDTVSCLKSIATEPAFFRF